eukprot:2526727-Prorocentrum_lima.AAC.1
MPRPSRDHMPSSSGPWATLQRAPAAAFFRATFDLARGAGWTMRLPRPLETVSLAQSQQGRH